MYSIEPMKFQARKPAVNLGDSKHAWWGCTSLDALDP
jgi:hypothetical protein